MTQENLFDVGPRVAGVKVGMVVRDITTGKCGEVVEVSEPCTRWTIHCLFFGDVAVSTKNGYRVLGPQSFFWTQFELVSEAA